MQPRTPPSGKITQSAPRFSPLLVSLFLCAAFVFLNDMQRAWGQNIPSTGTAKSRGKSDIVWSGIPLSQAVESLALAHKTTIWRDRRVDPGRAVNLRLQNASLEQVLAALGAGKLNCCYLEKCVYFGPSETAEVLPALFADAQKEGAKLPSARRKALQKLRNLHWAKLAEPRQIIRDCVQGAGFRLLNPEAIPHDLWSEGSFKGVAMPEMLTLLLAGFDLSFTFEDAKSLRLVPMDFSPSAREFQAIRRGEPPLTGERSEGDTEHAARRRANAWRLHMLSIKATDKRREVLLQELAFKMEIKLAISDAIREKFQDALREPISIEEKATPANEVFQHILEPVGLAIETNLDQISVVEASRTIEESR